MIQQHQQQNEKSQQNKLKRSPLCTRTKKIYKRQRKLSNTKAIITELQTRLLLWNPTCQNIEIVEFMRIPKHGASIYICSFCLPDAHNYPSPSKPSLMAIKITWSCNYTGYANLYKRNDDKIYAWDAAQHEAGILALLQRFSDCPSSIQKLHFGSLTPRGLIVATDYYRHGDVWQFIEKEKKLPSEQQVKNLARDLFKGLEWLHKKGIAHTDISPENFVITTDDFGNLRGAIIDFGYAQVKPNSIVEKETRWTSPRLCFYEFVPHSAETEFRIRFLQDEAGRSPGKLGCISWEIDRSYRYAHDTSCIDVPDACLFANDIFAAGVTIFCLLTGHRPFEESNEFDRHARKFINGEWLNEIVQSSTTTPLLFSNEAATFIFSCLTTEKSRISASRALEHPWLQT